MLTPSTTPTLPLAMSTAGTRLKIAAISGGHGLKLKIAEMGLNPGTEIELRQHERGAVVISAGNTRYALGAAMAHRIMVQAI
ncbi:MAG TPA: FeoA family protein [Orrella sp.]